MRKLNTYYIVYEQLEKFAKFEALNNNDAIRKLNELGECIGSGLLFDSERAFSNKYKDYSYCKEVPFETIKGLGRLNYELRPKEENSFWDFMKE